MKDPEDILAAQEITHPSDAALVRLAAVAVARPTDDVDVMTGRVSFKNPRDEKLARAIIQAVRSNLPAATTTREPRWAKGAAVAGLIAAGAAVALGVWSYNLNSALTAERAAGQKQAEQFTKQIRDLQADSSQKLTAFQEANTAALQGVASSTKESAQKLTSTFDEYLKRNASLVEENAKLKADLAAARAAAGSQPQK